MDWIQLILLYLAIGAIFMASKAFFHNEVDRLEAKIESNAELIADQTKELKGRMTAIEERNKAE